MGPFSSLFDVLLQLFCQRAGASKCQLRADFFHEMHPKLQPVEILRRIQAPSGSGFPSIGVLAAGKPSVRPRWSPRSTILSMTVCIRASLTVDLSVFNV